MVMELFKKIFTAITGEQPKKLQDISDRLKKVASSLEDGTLMEKIKNAVSKFANEEGEELDTEANTLSSKVAKKKEAACKENAGSSLIKITCNKKVVPITIPNAEEKIVRAHIADYKLSITAIDLSNCENIRTLGDNVFSASRYLSKVVLPKNIEVIGACAFKDCASLTSIDLSNYKKLRVIGSHAFDSCENLSIIRLPESIEEISRGAFKNCTSLTYLDFSNCKKLQAIGSHAFEACEGLSGIRFPENIEKIGEYAFKECTSLTSIDLSNNKKLQSIGSYAFESCKGLSGIRFPENIEKIGEYAFKECTSLTSIDLSNNKKLLSIGSYAFAACKGLSEIRFPENIEKIGEHVLYWCDGLTKIDLFKCKKLSEIDAESYIHISYWKQLNPLEIILPEGINEICDTMSAYTILYLPPTVKKFRLSRASSTFKIYCYSPKLEIIGNILALGDLYVLPQYIDSYIQQGKAEGIKVGTRSLLSFRHKDDSKFGSGHIYPIPTNKRNYFDRYK